MGILQACKDFLGIESGYDDDYEEDMNYNEYDNYEEETQKAAVSDYFEEDEPLMDGGFFSERRFPKRNERTNVKKPANRMQNYAAPGSNLKVVLCNPTEFDNCPVICGHLRSHMTVVLNLENVKSATEKRRIFDFVSGCCFALDCNIKKISEPVYVIAPINVDLCSESELENAKPEYLR